MARPTIRAKTVRASTTTATATSSSIPSNPRSLKKSIRKARHSAFVSRIEKTAPKASARSRRRKHAAAANNLVTGLESLADALPDDPVLDSVKFTSQSSNPENYALSLKKGIKSRPGAMKRKEKMVKSECERFGKNLAIIQATANAAAENRESVVGENKEEAKPQNSWAMLRDFIAATMEKKEEFVELEKRKQCAMDMDA